MGKHRLFRNKSQNDRSSFAPDWSTVTVNVIITTNSMLGRIISSPVHALVNISTSNNSCISLLSDLVPLHYPPLPPTPPTHTHLFSHPMNFLSAIRSALLLILERDSHFAKPSNVFSFLSFKAFFSLPVFLHYQISSPSVTDLLSLIPVYPF